MADKQGKGKRTVTIPPLVGDDVQSLPDATGELKPAFDASYVRQAGNWLQAYLEYTKESESPESYHTWIGMSSIASVVRRNVWIDQNLYILYPNLYIALVGPPARTAKSTALRMGRRLIQNVPGVYLGPDACSREQLIRALAESKFNNSCAMTVHSSEFSSLIDTSGILMLQFLTDIYDCDFRDPKGWRYETKTQGKDQVLNPFLNLIFGTTASYLAEAMPADAIGHGFTSRTVFIYEEHERHRRPFPAVENRPLAKALIDDLKHISSIYGQFQWTADGIKAYEDFYEKLYQSAPNDHRLEGYHWRKKIHVLKVAMILSLAESDDLLLRARDIVTATDLLTKLEIRMSKSFSAVGKYDYATDLERIAAYIKHNGPLPLHSIYHNNYFVGDHETVSKILATLKIMGAVDTFLKDQEQWVKEGPHPLPS